jgi:hypothetical protein
LYATALHFFRKAPPRKVRARSWERNEEIANRIFRESIAGEGDYICRHACALGVEEVVSTRVGSLSTDPDAASRGEMHCAKGTSGHLGSLT